MRVCVSRGRPDGTFSAFDFAKATAVDVPVRRFCRELVGLDVPTEQLEDAGLSIAYVVFDGHAARRFTEAKTDTKVSEADAQRRLAQARQS